MLLLSHPILRRRADLGQRPLDLGIADLLSSPWPLKTHLQTKVHVKFKEFLKDMQVLTRLPCRYLKSTSSYRWLDYQFPTSAEEGTVLMALRILIFSKQCIIHRYVRSLRTLKSRTQALATSLPTERSHLTMFRQCEVTALSLR